MNEQQISIINIEIIKLKKRKSDIIERSSTLQSTQAGLANEAVDLLTELNNINQQITNLEEGLTNA